VLDFERIGWLTRALFALSLKFDQVMDADRDARHSGQLWMHR